MSLFISDPNSFDFDGSIFIRWSYNNKVPNCFIIKIIDFRYNFNDQ